MTVRTLGTARGAGADGMSARRTAAKTLNNEKLNIEPQSRNQGSKGNSPEKIPLAPRKTDMHSKSMGKIPKDEPLKPKINVEPAKTQGVDLENS